jgi:hypothetical protein
VDRAEHRSFQGRTRRVPARRAELLRIGGGEAGRLIFEPGWRWSGQVKPMEGTASCEAPQFQYHVSGVLAIGMDGTDLTAGPGDITALPSGHDAWVVGGEPVVSVDWSGAGGYAR